MNNQSPSTLANGDLVSALAREAALLRIENKQLQRDLTLIEKLEAKIKLQQEAIEWCLEHGASLSGNNGKIYGNGCGCCADVLDIPDHLKEAILCERPSSG